MESVTRLITLADGRKGGYLSQACRVVRPGDIIEVDVQTAEGLCVEGGEFVYAPEGSIPTPRPDPYMQRAAMKSQREAAGRR